MGTRLTARPPLDAGRQLAATASRHLATLATRFAGLFGGPLVSRSLRVGGTATLAGDLALLLGRHGGEASAGLADNFEHVGTLPFCAKTCSEMLATFG